MHSGKPKKLRDGNWGAVIEDPAEDINSGDVIEITSRGGKSWNMYIDRVIWRGQSTWSGSEIAIVSTTKDPSAPPQDSPSYSGSKEFVIDVTKLRASAPPQDPPSYSGADSVELDDDLPF